MAGHSHAKNIMHRKGKSDAARSKVFSKLAREITVAAKLGAPDPAFNARLRLAVAAARAQSCLQTEQELTMYLDLTARRHSRRTLGFAEEIARQPGIERLHNNI